MVSWNIPALLNKISTDIPGIRALLLALAKWDMAGTEDIPAGAKRLGSVASGVQVQHYNGSAWGSTGKLMHDVDMLDGCHAATAATPNTIAVRDTNGSLPGNITGNAATATAAVSLSETLPVDKGGTGATTSAAARANLGCNNAANITAGLLSTAQGGTGRSDGMVTDVYLPDLGKSAVEIGQLGKVKYLGGNVDCNTLISEGRYRVSTTGQLNGPMLGAGVIEVTETDGYISHTFTSDFTGETATRGKGGTASVWSRWIINRVYTTTLNLYVSKTGDDNNDGLSEATAVASFNRAYDILCSWRVSRNASVSLRFGPGEWGDVFIVGPSTNMPLLNITSISTTIGSGSNFAHLPVFNELRCYFGRFKVYNVVAKEINAYENAVVTLGNYLRFGRVYTPYGGHIGFSGGVTYDIFNISTNALFLSASTGKIYAISANTIFNFVEPCTYSGATVDCSYGALVAFRSPKGYTSFSGQLPTGNKNFNAILGGTIVTYGSSSYDFIPGNGTFTISTGGTYNGDDGGISSGFVAGTRMLFQQAAAPAGWVKETSATYNDAALRVVTGSTAGVGGVDAFSKVFGTGKVTASTSAGGTVGATTLTVEQMPTHNHGYKAAYPSRSTGSGEGVSPNGTDYTYNTGGSKSHTHSITPTAHTHTLTMNIKYADIIICTKS